jgi:DeoR/GlpR family transcriptional regulator of sugar metabolism
MHPEDAALARKMTAKAKRTLGLIHSAKFYWRARISSVPLTAIDMLVTDRLRSDLGAELAQADVEVVETGTATQDRQDPGPAP